MLVYYAHCQSLYGTKQEERDIQLLEQLGFKVESPSYTATQSAAHEIRRCYEADEPYGVHKIDLRASSASEAVMEALFVPIVRICDALAFRALPDGRIPAGVAMEIEVAMAAGKPIFELPSGLIRRRITVEETREYLREVGQR